MTAIPLHRIDSVGFSDRIDKEIQMCIQRMTLLRSSENAKESLLETLMNEKYQEIGDDLDPVKAICDIIVK